MNTPESAPPCAEPAAPAPQGPKVPPLAPKGPWLFWGSMSWLGGVFIAWTSAQICALLVFLLPYLSSHPGTKINPEAFEDLMADANTISFITIVSVPFALAVVFLAVRLRRWSAREYFALKLFTWKQLGYGVAAIVATLLATEAIGYFCGHADQSVFMENMMASIRSGAGVWPLLLAALVFAPIGEEIVFRGFLYRGLAASRLGMMGAIILSAGIWAAIHMQYDLFQMGVIFVIGLTLGAMRAWSGSTYLAIVLHSLVNAAAFSQAFLATGPA
jgi:uncharacterized protein